MLFNLNFEFGFNSLKSGIKGAKIVGRCSQKQPYIQEINSAPAAVLLDKTRRPKIK